MVKSTGKRHGKKEHRSTQPKRRRAPGKTIEARENQLISMSVDLAARQIRAGTASSQVITHFLKLGSTQALLEKEKLGKENQLLQAKAEALKSQKKLEEVYANALAAMRSYGGLVDSSSGDGQDDED